MEAADPSVWQRDEVQQWLRDHSHEASAALSLQKSPFPEGPTSAQLAQQVAGWQKAKGKLPTYAQTPGIAYPPSLSMEQCSSEDTARWKAQRLQGNTIADLTAGFGVDAFFLGENFEHLHLVEQNPLLAQLAQHNLGLLRSQPFTVHHGTSEAFLDSLPSRLDWIYLDPARRDADGGRVFRLEQCSPDAAALRKQMLALSKRVLLKASPVLDIQQALEDLGGAERVTVLAVRNEVKELLFWLGPNPTDDPEIEAVNLTATGEEHFSFRRSQEAVAQATYGPLSDWIFEPNAAILKAGAFRQISQQFGLTKLHPNTHLYTAPADQPNFPGRRFRVLGEATAQKKALKKWLKEPTAMVGTRNFPMSAPQLRTKLGLKEGGSRYIMGFTNHEDQKRLAILEPNLGD